MTIGWRMRTAVLLVMASAGVGAQAQEGGPAGSVAKWVFVEQEEGIQPYQTRMMANARFLRIDDGEGAPDYVLFDRKQRTIYSVTAATRSILIVENREMDAVPPFELDLKETRVEASKDLPEVAGRSPRHYRLDANGEECSHVVAVDGLLPDGLAAMREFGQVLAGESAATFAAIPADLHDACEMAAHTFAPDRHLQFGFPIQEWDDGGYSRYLLDYDAEFVPAEEDLFSLPEDYVRATIEDVRAGRAGSSMGH